MCLKFNDQSEYGGGSVLKSSMSMLSMHLFHAKPSAADQQFISYYPKDICKQNRGKIKYEQKS